MHFDRAIFRLDFCQTATPYRMFEDNEFEHQSKKRLLSHCL